MPSSQALSPQRAKTQVKYAALVQKGKPPLRSVPDTRDRKVFAKGIGSPGNTKALSARVSKSALTKNTKVSSDRYTLKQQDLRFLVLDDAIEIIIAKTRESSRLHDVNGIGEKGVTTRPVQSINPVDLTNADEMEKANTKQSMKPVELMSSDEANKSTNTSKGSTAPPTKQFFLSSIREKFRSSRTSSRPRQSSDTINITNPSVAPESPISLDGDAYSGPIDVDTNLPPTPDSTLQDSKMVKEEEQEELQHIDGDSDIIAENPGQNNIETCRRDEIESTKHFETIVQDEVREPCTNEAATNDEEIVGIESRLPSSKDSPEDRGTDAVVAKVVPKSDAVGLLCSHCKKLIHETERHLKEYPYTYSDKTLILVYHHDCYQARKQIEMKKLEVDHEFMSICKTLRAAKAKSNKSGKQNHSILRNGQRSKYRNSAPPERVDSLDELIYAFTAGESSEQSSLEKSKHVKKTKGDHSGKRGRWSFDESQSPSYSSLDYDTSSNDDASHVDFCDSDGANTTGGRRGNRKLHRDVRRSRRDSRHESRQERSLSKSRGEHHPRGRSQERSQKSSKSKSDHRGAGQTRSRRHDRSPTNRRNRNYEDPLPDDDISISESRESFQDHKHRSPLLQRSNPDHDSRRGPSPEQQRSNRGDPRASARGGAAVVSKRMKEPGSNHGDDRFFGRSLNPSKKAPMAPSPKLPSGNTGGMTTGTSQRNSHMMGVLKGTSQSERGSRTLLPRVTEVNKENRSLRGVRTSSLVGKHERIPITRGSRAFVAAKSKETSSESNGMRFSRSSSLVRSKVDVGLVSSKAVATRKKVEPKNQNSMSKMIGKPKPVTKTNKAKPTMVVRKRPKPKATAE